MIFRKRELGFYLGAMFCVLLLACSKPLDSPHLSDNALELYEERWAYDASLQNGYWGKSEDYIFYFEGKVNKLLILDRRSGTATHTVEIPEKVNDSRNAPIYTNDSKVYLFFSQWSDDCVAVDLSTGEVAVLRERPLGTIDASQLEKIDVSDEKIKYQNLKDNNQWESEFRGEGFRVLSYEYAFIAEQNIYLWTQLYEGKIRLTDFLPGGNVTGTPKGNDLKAYNKDDGRLLWHFPCEKRLYLKCESRGVTLVECTTGDKWTYRAHHADSGKKLWKQTIRGGRFSACDTWGFVFLSERALYLLETDSGECIGFLEFPYKVQAMSFPVTDVTPAFYWNDAFLVCKNIQQNDVIMTRFHYYTKRTQ